MGSRFPRSVFLCANFSLPIVAPALPGELSSMWTESALHDLIASRMNSYQMIVVANREPYQHRFAGDSIECIRPASGMATALDPVIRASGGIWVAHGSADADRLTVD